MSEATDLKKPSLVSFLGSTFPVSPQQAQPLCHQLRGGKRPITMYADIDIPPNVGASLISNSRESFSTLRVNTVYTFQLLLLALQDTGLRRPLLPDAIFGKPKQRRHICGHHVITILHGP